MTIYQEEMRRRARPYGCDCVPNKETGNLDIFHDNAVIAEVTPNGNLRYPRPADQEAQELVDKLVEDAQKVREYVSLYESSPAMPQVDVGQYRKFSEYGSTVLAGTYDDKFGFMFCTWDKSNDGSYVTQGHYTTDYDGAKEDFAVRSGLIPSSRLFNCDQSIDMLDAIEYKRNFDEDLTYEMDKKLEAIQNQLIESHSQLQARLAAHDQTPGMTMGGM